MPVPSRWGNCHRGRHPKASGNALTQSPLPGNVQPILVAGSTPFVREDLPHPFAYPYERRHASLDSPALAEFLRMRQVAIGTFRSLAAQDTYELIPQGSMRSVSHARGATLRLPASPREARHEMIGGRR
jgi:hypothetical protein